MAGTLRIAKESMTTPKKVQNRRKLPPSSSTSSGRNSRSQNHFCFSAERSAQITVAVNDKILSKTGCSHNGRPQRFTLLVSRTDSDSCVNPNAASAHPAHRKIFGKQHLPFSLFQKPLFLKLQRLQRRHPEKLQFNWRFPSKSGSNHKRLKHVFVFSSNDAELK